MDSPLPKALTEDDVRRRAEDILDSISIRNLKVEFDGRPGTVEGVTITIQGWRRK